LLQIFFYLSFDYSAEINLVYLDKVFFKMEQYSIHDLDKLSGIKAHTIRVWERRYNIVSPQRTGTNRRRYDDDDLRRIINISILRRNGFRISEIAGFSTEEIEEKVSFLSRDVLRKDTQIDKLVVAMVEHNEKEVNEILFRYMIKGGLEETMTEVVLPFMKRVGLMWQTGSTDIGSEHFISNIFRQKLIASIDSLTPLLKPERKKAILFLPENELHEIGLLFFHYLLKKEGHESLYLGQSSPLSSVVAINKHWKADIIITGLMSGYPDVKADDYIKDLGSMFKREKILVAGELAKTGATRKYKNIFPINSAEDLRAHLR
jgi:MerR family transcriptional regulator, light-induced transcriptional regulator